MCERDSQLSPEKEYRDKLLWMVKKEVKQIMEEAVTRKFVHEESGVITSLCAAVDACLAHGIKRRALGLFKTNSTTALLQKVAKNFELAATLAQMVADIENSDPNKRSSSSSDSTNKFKNSQNKKLAQQNTNSTRYLWIRLALFEKHLAKIVEHLVQNSSKYYEKDALVADPVSGQILASLLVGPCALDYSKMKTQDHLWTDPPADELVQRHKLSSGYPLTGSKPMTPPSLRKLGIQYRKDAKISGSSEESHRSISFTPREYVDSLHQNNKSTLLYGKNNVFMQPRDNTEKMPGYLSLHQNLDVLTIKWTPNQLMNGCYSTTSESSSDSAASIDKSMYWDLAFSLDVANIVYLHCHQYDTGGTIVLVGLDGVQRPPVHFPKGGHLLAFLSCLETGLLPHGQLDPPLWSQRGKGKVFPKLRRKGKNLNRVPSSSSNSNGNNQSVAAEEEEEQSDYVFRILTSLKPDSIGQELMDPKSTANNNNKPDPCPSQSIQILCNTMKKQIISRAFYGWLAHCRHLKTVRTHLSGLVNMNIVPEEAAGEGLTALYWTKLSESGSVNNASDIYKRVYFGGIEHSIRKKVWPYLLGHYPFGSSQSERDDHDIQSRRTYETTMSEWLAVEAIVRQRDKEMMAANLAKLSSESTTSDIPLVGPKDSCMSNEVFDELSSGESFEDSNQNAQDKPEKENQKRGSDGNRKPLLRHQPAQIVESLATSDTIDQGADEPPTEQKQSEFPSDTDCISPASSDGGIYSGELLDQFSLNIHRIDKDVQRCDRNYWYFTLENLEKLRNIMCTYVWEHLDTGYVQGMCDLVAPLLVIFNDEMLTYNCFCELMKRMVANFPHGGAMDTHFANMRSLIQILDSEMFELMHQNGDYTHFYFCYRWFLLDFKRELVYEDVFSVWEAIWAASHVASKNFVLFIALALVEYYRDIILENNMDFTDIIKFFNEMAERHDAKAVLKIARDLVHQIQTLIDTN